MRATAALLALLAALALPSRAVAFRDAAVGTPIRDRTLATVDGGSAPLLASGQVSVFVFVRPGQEHSESALRQLAALERELANRPVRFVAVVSGGDAPADARRLVRDAGAQMPILVDAGDALYGEVGVVMTPSAGVVGRDGRLAAFQPFRKVNYLDAMRAQVQVALGDLDPARLAAVLDPGAPAQTSGSGRAHARLQLARTLLAAGSVDAAVENARAGIALEPGAAEGHRVLSEALARAGRCEDAEREAAAARKLAPAAAPAAAVACRR